MEEQMYNERITARALEGALCLSILSMLSACPEISGGKPWEAGTGEPALTDSYLNKCYWTWSNFADYPEPMHAVCIAGTHPDNPPSNLQLTVPCQAFGSAASPTTLAATYTTADATTFLDQVTNGGGYICQAGTGAGSYHADFDRTDECDYYTKDKVSYVLEDAMGALYSDDPACEYENIIAGSYARVSYDKVDTSLATCTPGSATFQLVARGVSGDAPPGSVGSTISLMPIASTAARFPERAWLRKVEVSAWGTVDNLRVARFREHLRLGASGASGGVALRAPKSVLTFAAGAAPMSTMFAADHIAISPETVLPTVKLTWSCESDPNAYKPIGEGFVGTPLAPFGMPHRIVLWPDWTGKKLRIAPEGRFVDYSPIKLTMTGARSATFKGHLSAYDATLSGVISQVGTTIYLTSATVVIGGVSRTLANQTFSRL